MADYLAILPEILLIVLVAALIIVDLRVSDDKKKTLGWLTFWGLAATFVIAIVFSAPGSHATDIWGGMLRHDLAAFIFKLVFLFGAAVTTIFAMDWKGVGERGEFYLLLVVSTLGMTLMGAANDMVMIFLAIETASIPLYVMAGFMTRDERSNEAGFKYLLFGALTSAVMVYGFSLLFGFSGGLTNLSALATGVADGSVPPFTLIGTIILVLAGFGFKVAAFPFHFWAPDVYEGAPTPVTAFLSTASKAAGFAVVVRTLLVAFPSSIPLWSAVVALLATFSMIVGNTIALSQKNIKRLLAYSSIAHAGYILVGVAAASELGVVSVLYYIAAYMVTNLAAFGAVMIFYQVVGSDDIKAYAGLSRRHPGLAFGMLLAFLSLAGIPPLGGFFAKILVFAAAVEAGLIWLAIVGVLNAIIGLYYYLIVLKVVYHDRSEDEDKPLPVSRPQMTAFVVCLALMVLLGTVLGPMYDWSTLAATALF